MVSVDVRRTRKKQSQKAHTQPRRDGAPRFVLGFIVRATRPPKFILGFIVWATRPLPIVAESFCCPVYQKDNKKDF
jgi:hypothetical protein